MLRVIVELASHVVRSTIFDKLFVLILNDYVDF